MRSVVLWLLLLAGICYSSAEVDVPEIDTDEQATTLISTSLPPTKPTDSDVVDSTSDTLTDLHPEGTMYFTTTTATPSDENTESSPLEFTKNYEEPDNNEEHDELHSSSSENECDGVLSQRDMEKFAEAIMTFSKDLLKEVYQETNSPNVVLSPFSIALGLFQLTLGAEDETEKKLLETLHVGSLPCLHEKLYKVTRHLTQTAISVATRMYVKKGFHIKKEFLKKSEKFYGAKPVNLKPSMKENMESINKWVSDATQGKIKNFLTNVPANVVLMLLNAIHFRGVWKTKFDSSKTLPYPFYINNEDTVMVDMMQAFKYPLSYFMSEKLDGQVARLPFKGNMSFVVVIPNQVEWNMSKILENLNKSELYSRFHKEKPSFVKFPKLGVNFKLELTEALTKLGLGQLFSSPNLGKISEEPLFVSSVEHQSTLDLNEDGVEAAGTTAIVSSRSLLTFTVNRPFIFFLFDDNSGLPLFLGFVRNPKPGFPKNKKEAILSQELYAPIDTKSTIPK